MSTNRKLRLVLFVTCFALLAGFFHAGLVWAGNGPIVVNSLEDIIADDGNCTLREAILAANSNTGAGGCKPGVARDVIRFALPGEGPHTIKLGSPLPQITVNLLIDGVTGTGATCKPTPMPMIVLDGSSAGAADGLHFGGSSSGGVKGLAFQNFQRNGLVLQGAGSGFTEVSCNTMGLMTDGRTKAGNGAAGIYVNNSPFNQVLDNLIGGNGVGIFIFGNDAEDNVFSGNYIGVTPDGFNVGNGSDGILATNSGPQVIGGFYGDDGCCIGNTIAYNGGHGISVVAQPTISQEKGIRGNRIFANEKLGIDLANDGVTMNDPGDADGENDANGLQNFPVIQSAQLVPGQITIAGSFNSRPSRFYVLEFFANDVCDPSGYGEGQRPLGFIRTQTDAGGDVAFSAVFSDTVPSQVVGGNQITGTATDSDGNTSEFSQCVAATGTGAAGKSFLPLVRR